MSSQAGLGWKRLLREIGDIFLQARQTWRLVPSRHKMALFGASGVMALGSAAGIGIPLLLGRLVDQVKVGTEQQLGAAHLYQVAGIYLALIALCYFLRELLNVARRYLVENTCTRLEKVLTVKLVSRLLEMELTRMTTEKIGSLHGRIGRSIVGFIRFLRLAFLDLFPPLLTGAFALLAALSKQPWLALVMAGVIPASLLLTLRQIASQRGVRLQLLRSREEMDGTIVEQLGGLDYIRAANTHRYEVQRVARAAEKKRAREIRHHFQMSLFGCMKALNEGLFHILVIALAVYLAVEGEISFGDILTFSMLFMSVMAPLNEVHRGLDEGHECSLQVADLLQMLDAPTDRSFSPVSVQEPQLREGEPVVSVQGLRVEYEPAEGSTRVALDDISLEIRHGETVGIVGRSGSGKSTWLRVLMRLTHPVAGKVFLGGVDLEHISRASIGRLIGYVGQSPFVFAGTIAENIAYGSTKPTPEDIERAARMAVIHDEILAMPGGYSAPVAERGSNLSGGQKQRLALARVFLENPPLLILDEGTSALDTISERSVQRAIDAARADRTVILVAHRLSTLLDVDRIFVFDNGRLVDQGTYAELQHRDGVFAELARCARSSPAEEPPARPLAKKPEEQPAAQGEEQPEFELVPTAV
jgi:ATP-binding cassette subfamily B protein